MTGVVDLPVVVLDGSDEHVAAQRGELGQRLLLAQVPVRWDAVPAPHRVVHEHSAADVEALPDVVRQGDEKRNRVCQMWTRMSLWLTSMSRTQDNCQRSRST